MEKVSRLHKAKAGVGCDGFHAKVHLDLTETRGGAKWKMAATSMHDDVLLDSEEYHE